MPDTLDPVVSDAQPAAAPPIPAEPSPPPTFIPGTLPRPGVPHVPRLEMRAAPPKADK